MEKQNILVTNLYSGVPFAIVQEELPRGFEIIMPKENSQEALESLAPAANYILAGGRQMITRQLLDKAVRLKMIQRSGVGLDTLDLDAIREKGIPLYVNQGVNAQSVAEHALLLMLASLRRLPEIDRDTKAGIWKKQEQGIRTRELCGKTVGLIGMGHIARALVALLRPFCVNILYYNLFREPEDFEQKNRMLFVPVDELLTQSDIVSIHCALTDETRNMINADTIGKMRKGAVLINTARGGIVDSQAVARALHCGKLSYAALDVYQHEPVVPDDPVLCAEHIILTPHIAGVTEDSFRAMMKAAFRNIVCFDQGLHEDIALYRYL